MCDLFTLTSAFEYSKRGMIEKWVHAFLNGEGNNKSFSEGLKIERRHFIGPVKVPLKLFRRCCGPEEDLKYTIDLAGFESRVDSIYERIKSGWDMPPLIVNYANGEFELSDGNHRYEALYRNKDEECYVVFWITGDEDYKQFQANFYDYLD